MFEGVCRRNKTYKLLNTIGLSAIFRVYVMRYEIKKSNFLKLFKIQFFFQRYCFCRKEIAFTFHSGFKKHIHLLCKESLEYKRLKPQINCCSVQTVFSVSKRAKDAKDCAL